MAYKLDFFPPQFCTYFCPNQKRNWNLWVSSAYSISIGRIPVDCMYAVKTEATIKNTEVNFLLEIWGTLAKLAYILLLKPYI